MCVCVRLSWKSCDFEIFEAEKRSNRITIGMRSCGGAGGRKNAQFMLKLEWCLLCIVHVYTRSLLLAVLSAILSVLCSTTVAAVAALCSHILNSIKFNSLISRQAFVCKHNDENSKTSFVFLFCCICFIRCI